MQREAESYVWGTNWSLADPGFQALLAAARAAGWSRRLGKQMFETTLGTDRFRLRLVYHSMRARKTSEKHATVSQIIRSF
jgi:hypothetical protein